MSECGPIVQGSGDLNKNESEELLQRMKNLAEDRVKKTGMPIADSLREIAGELKAEDKFMQKIYERNALLTIQAKRNIKDFVRRFPTMGEGLLTFLEGSSKIVEGARKSVDYQSKSLHGKYFGRLVADLEEAGVMREFKKSDPVLVQKIYREMGATHPGMPSKSVTGDETAFKIAKIIDNLTAEMVARQNRAGSFITRIPGYIVRQTHDMSAIRALGSLGNNQESKLESYKAWSNFVKPLIDNERTFKGADQEKVLRNIHEALYTGIHGAERPETDVSGIMVKGSLAKKISERRVMWFKDADSAYRYNQAFGTKNFKESIMQDLHERARSIALMENMGPSPDQTLSMVTRELQEEARSMDSAGKHIDSLRDWRIQAVFNEITGRNEISKNPSLSNMIGTAKVLMQLSKMGAVTLSSFADRAFLQSEMAFQGISNLHTIGKQITGFAKRSPEEMRTLRLMGVGMDGLIGNSLSRYSSASTTSGWGHTLQKWFFDMNFLNQWTDVSKATAGELMSAHLGEHAGSSFDKLPGDLSKVLSLYDITPSRWDAIRSQVSDHNGQSYITSDMLGKLSDEQVGKLVTERGLNASAPNIQRERDALDTALRTYFTDRIDIAIPTPGAAERKYATWNTQAGTPLGEAVRLVMLFKSFPITILNKVVGRNIYGNGASSMKQWLLNDHRGKFNLAMLMAMGTVAGYTSGVVRDALKGREPKPLITDGKINMATLNDAALRGGSLGILGDVMMSQYSHDYNSFLESASGPMLSQLDQLFSMKTSLQQGKNIAAPLGKMTLDNTPFINLFYIRPVLDYYILWHMQEMLSPGSLRRQEAAVENRTHQQYFMKPSKNN